LATIALAKIKDSARYGAIEINEKGEIEMFLEKEEGSR
jgi:dTDP-glucose pyrophosphorylase